MGRYPKCLLEYAIMPIGKKDTSVQGGIAPFPRGRKLWALSIPFMGGWFNPKVGYHASFCSSHPFADVVGDDTC